MYFIVETNPPLNKLMCSSVEECFIHPIRGNDKYHYALGEVILLYLRGIHSNKGYIINFHHNEALHLSYKEIIDLLNKKCKKIYLLEKKESGLLGINTELLFGINYAKYLQNDDILEESKFDTNAHRFFQYKFKLDPNLNKHIPIVKHFEKCEQLFSAIDFKSLNITSSHFKYYNEDVNDVFQEIECTGIEIQPQHSTQIKAETFLSGSKYLSYYNVYNRTGRPTNVFNGFNFLNLKKDSGERGLFIPSNDYFLDFDYRGYQIRLICDLIDFDFSIENIHEYLASFYFKKDDISKEEYEQAKQLTFRYTYGENIPEDLLKYEFFAKIQHFKEEKIKEFKSLGHILSPIHKRPIYGIIEERKILPYLLQAMETERNVSVLLKLLPYLRNKYSKVVLYSYDSFLVDFSKKDGAATIRGILEILQEGDFPVSMKKGKNYHEMIEF